MKAWNGELKGHSKKVLGLSWHRSAEGVLATHAADNAVKIWDIES